MTSKDGFSVVAPTKVMAPDSTWGRMASCWALLNRCTSSTKSTVGRSASRRTRLASSTAARRSATPEVTAETAMKCAPTIPARSEARVVLPTPGGPQSTMEGSWPEATALWCPGPSRCACPTTSSRVRGRMRAARGAAPLARSRQAWSNRSSPLPLLRAMTAV